ncbi:MAG: hypothetical protein HY900_04635 [Deltaproteobacteria bacterium]|nr:hypothetical protein [Deltaproteobacteria bacterium]
MDVSSAWENLSLAISDLNQPRGDYELKLATAVAAVELLFAFPPEEILKEVRGSALPHRAVVSWLVFEASRLSGVDQEAVEALRRLYESSCPPGQGIIPPPTPAGRPPKGSARTGQA